MSDTPEQLATSALVSLRNAAVDVHYLLTEYKYAMAEITALREFVRQCEPEIHPADLDVGLDVGIEIHSSGFTATHNTVAAVERALNTRKTP